MIPWTVAHQAPPSMGFSRQEYWSGLLFPSPGDLSGLLFPSPGDLPDPGIKPRSPALWADALTSEPPGNTFTLTSWIYLCVCVCTCVHAQLCLTLCDPMDSSPPGSSIHGIFQARIPEIRSPFPPPGIFLTQELNPRLLYLLHW